VKDRVRQKEARDRAEVYAPKPKDSRLMYGVVAVSVLLLALISVGGFYAIDVWNHPLLVGALGAGAVLAALVLRRLRAQRHDTAHRFEYDSDMGTDDDQDIGATKG
jgi:cytochrome c-type biogenesis protein CcmH/NrfG